MLAMNADNAAPNDIKPPSSHNSITLSIEDQHAQCFNHMIQSHEDPSFIQSHSIGKAMTVDRASGNDDDTSLI